ncbi:MAG: carboxylating nicotinate-nucleotide diphosphorylase [Saprospiraceae bacterium]|nr:carboxylating nicotinate-nucleotide diphosphorylase [Saprospiraceae bacterium]MCF8248886.1 carboxylating nicotinate-nucleotide diphosphorylase [Saprospiraceae bacterium]MCF8279611.1 carboxylating nicotinate-nucleotide diphosphorylase [Bacteroidales bacterium]MCF8310171.1 carboxylating nicotinate-nucleotide diphosphorylase [Saprospiraceae bacterium]MCF8439071.1 carboxylating nicotinate-nucleotide diphosphorylase [Saprospiraceae bacterium]
MTFEPRFEQQLTSFIEQALLEDAPQGDKTSLACIPPDAQCTANLLVKDAGILAGVEIAHRIFMHVDPKTVFTKFIEDGTHVSFGDVAFQVNCNTQALLRAERVALNVMQRLSGIATLAHEFVFEIEDLPVKILDTRKTTPLLRFLEKYAVRTGGCYNYRESLSDWFMIKDNHIMACGGVQKAIRKVAEYQKENGLNLGVTVEVKNLVELHQVLETGNVTRIMFDNFELPLLAEAVATVNNRFETEASGGVNIHSVRRVALSGVDFISVGALTHSATSLDLSLKIK